MIAYLLCLFAWGIIFLIRESWPTFRVIRFYGGFQTGYRDLVDWVFILPPFRFEVYPVTYSNWGKWWEK